MAFLRVVFVLLFGAALVCFGWYVATREVRWRRRGLFIVKWTVIAALVFFAVLIAQLLWEPR